MSWGYYLQTKIVTIVLTIVVLCVVFSTTLSLYRVNAVVRERLDAAGIFSSQTLAVFSVESLLAWDYPALQLSIEHAAKYDVYLLAVDVYHKNKLVASYKSGTEEDGIEYTAPVVVEVSGKKENLGNVRIVLSEKKYHAFYMQQIYSLIFLGLILGLGDTFLIYLTINKIVLRPLKRIEEQTKVIGRGNLKHQIKIKSKDEIGRLAQSLNFMTKNLRTSLHKTEDYKKHLEARVDELEKFHKLTVGRENKMIELKARIKKITANKGKTDETKKISKIVSSSEPQNCWDFYKCEEKIKKDCPAYKTDSGRECWLVATDYCPYLGKEFETCDECPWFKKINSKKG